MRMGTAWRRSAGRRNLRVDLDAPKRGLDYARGTAFNEMRAEFVQHMRPRLAARRIEHGDETGVAGPNAKPRSGAPKAEIIKARFARIAPNTVSGPSAARAAATGSLSVVLGTASTIRFALSSSSPPPTASARTSSPKSSS